jgi:hypothetical protein
MADEKKIIIDEDWKTQVAAEKEAYEREHAASTSQSDGSSAASESAGEGAAEPSRYSQFPPASFEMLITMFATEAMVGLGQLPDPMTGQPHADMEHAKYAIDMLEMIAAKTKGNLAASEENGLRELLHQLRMAFIAASNQRSAVSGQPEGASGVAAKPNKGNG